MDISLVAVVVYWLIMLSKRTRAWQIIWGLIIFLLLVFTTQKLELHTINYLLRVLIPLGPVVIVILFFPELRSALENMGRMANFRNKFSILPKEDISSLVGSIVRSSGMMSRKKIGLLIVIERETPLDNIVDTGTKIDSLVSQDLLGTIFYPGTPLHDGAVIIRGKRIVAAGCTLPLTEIADMGTMIHTRHKAALGVAEESDAAVIVVSEETGTISMALEGKLYRDLDEQKLTKWLRLILAAKTDKTEKSDFVKQVGNIFRKNGKDL